MHRVSLVLFALLFCFSSPSVAEDSPASEHESPPTTKRDDSSRWDSPWDSGMLFLPPLGSLDLLYRYRFGEFGDEHLGFLTLSLSLEKIAGSSKEVSDRAALETPVPAVSRVAASTSEAEVVRGSRESVEQDSSLRGALELARAIVEVVRASAPEKAELLEIEAAQGRSRTSGALPELRLRGAHGFDQSVAPSTSGVYGAPVATRGGWDTAFEVRLTFRLGKLLYDDGESSLLAMKHRLSNQIEARIEETLEVLAKFQSARRRLLLEGLEEEELVKQLVLREEALARLDVLTGGRALGLVEKHLGPRALAVAPEAEKTPENPAN